MKIVTGLGVAAVMALSSCAMVEQERDERGKTVNCGPGACEFAINVVSCNDIRGEEYIVVQRGHRGPIRWRLDPRSGWEFARTGGIVIRGNDGEFDSQSNSASLVTWNNNHRTKKTYKYDVVVMNSASGQVCRWDPSIMN